MNSLKSTSFAITLLSLPQTSRGDSKFSFRHTNTRFMQSPTAGGTLALAPSKVMRAAKDVTDRCIFDFAGQNPSLLERSSPY